MKKGKKTVIIGLEFLLLIVLTATIGINSGIAKTRAFAIKENEEKTAAVQQKVNQTIEMLENYAQSEEITSSDLSYEDKARILTNWNEGQGYMMIRIVDENMYVYKEGVGAASSLASRDYLQRLFKTGEVQVTDAFLAGADGETINYTVAVPMMKNDKVAGALFAAIYGEQMDGFLEDTDSKNVLVGGELQYMGGISRQEFGLPVAKGLEEEGKTSRPVENILIDFNERNSGVFWGYGGGKLQCFTYSPIEHTNWVILTEVNVFDVMGKGENSE